MTIASLVQNELERTGDQDRRRALQQFLVTPFVRSLPWPDPDRQPRGLRAPSVDITPLAAFVPKASPQLNNGRQGG